MYKYAIICTWAGDLFVSFPGNSPQSVGSLLPRQRRRVRLHQNRPEDVNILAGAGFDILVQNVYPSPCDHQLKNEKTSVWGRSNLKDRKGFFPPKGIAWLAGAQFVGSSSRQYKNSSQPCHVFLNGSVPRIAQRIQMHEEENRRGRNGGHQKFQEAYSSSELCGGGTTASSTEREGIEATPWGGWTWRAKVIILWGWVHVRGAIWLINARKKNT